MVIRLLPQNLVNQIAAGEVVERPASAIKELMENAIDAGATRIDVRLQEGGKTFFAVSDNGKGMTAEELKIAIQRHATSKLPHDDLLDIAFLGFRGEALPSIASVAKMTLTSRIEGAENGWSLSVEGGKAGAPVPAPHAKGTTLEVKELFYNVPARLKFLKSDQSEQGAVREVFDRLAMSHPEIAFSLATENRKLAHYPETNSLFDRVAMVIGRQFKENALPVQAAYEDIQLAGFIGLPTYTRATSSEQYLFVNGRSVKDKMLLGAVRGAYQGLMGHGSDGHPVLALFLSVPKNKIDVNVSPAKTEVRFSEAGRIRGLMVASLRNTLAEHGQKTASTIAIGALDTLTPREKPVAYTMPLRHTSPIQHTFALQDSYQVKAESPAAPAPTAEEDFPPLGFAKAQVHKTYIIAQTQEGVVLVDQHAAHERLTYEKMMQNIGEHPQTQLLLVPEIVDLKPEEVALLNARAGELRKMGWVIDPFGPDSVAVRELPALLDKTDLAKTIQDLADTLRDFDDTVLLKDKMKDICARLACHGSVRAGRPLSVDEMNALLRQMEACGTSGQCIHGRPTYIELKLKDIEKLFHR
ncbi:MAG: DNA mismatch repair endonuclease MutL [Alphaproteobacteria bacterium]